MKPASTLQYLYLSRLARPAHERVLYRALRRRSVRSIVEIGMGDGRRALRLLAVAQRFRPNERLSYSGIDLFEARPAGAPGLALKDAHRELTRTGVQLRLVPGDPWAALSRCANALANTDLLVISADHEAEALARAWFYLPRMLHEGSLVFLEEGATGNRHYRQLSYQEAIARAQSEPSRRAA